MKIKKMIDEKIGKSWRKVIDQVGHFAWAFVALFPIFYMGPSVISGALSGLLIALPRELVDQWPIEDWKDTALDTLFFIIGGAVIGMAF